VELVNGSLAEKVLHIDIFTFHGIAGELVYEINDGDDDVH
jgi:hypothetical protein